MDTLGCLSSFHSWLGVFAVARLMRELCSRETDRDRQRDREAAACFADYTQRKICDFLHWMQYPAVPRWAQGVGGRPPKSWPGPQI